MDETADCRRVRPLLAELATGAATGIDRDWALRHVEGCVACQRELAELALTADRLLMLVPEREPPAGFETAVMNRIAAAGGTESGGVEPLGGGDPRTAEPVTARRPRRVRPPWRRTTRGTVTPTRPATATAPAAIGPAQTGPGTTRRPVSARRSVRVVAALLVLLLAGLVGAGVAYWRGGEDRHLADQYRHGAPIGPAYTRSSPVVGADGAVVGHLYVYPGSPAWAIVSLTSAPAPGAYDMSILTRDGVRYQVGVCTVTGHTGVTGYALPVPVNRIETVDLVHDGIWLTIRPG